MKRFKAWQTYIFFILILSFFLIAGCGDNTVLQPGGNLSPVTPTVTFTDPANGDTGVAINKKIAATFSVGMDPLTITSTTFTVAGVTGTVTYDPINRIAIFSPASNLAINTTYTATITTAAKSPAGNALAANYTWSFTTGAAPDTTPPTVSFTDPANGNTGVAINKKIVAIFSEGMDPLTINTTTFTVAGVTGTVTYDPITRTATFTPAGNLAVNTNYTATITTAARDLEGNALAINYTWNFTTGAAPDTTPPTVTFTDPANGDTGVAINKKISATFSKGMDPLTINTTSFTVAVTGPGVTPISGTVTYVGLIATFKPAGNLAFNTTYTAMITTSARDLAGNALAVHYTWRFTTGTAPDTTPPTVTFTDPANGVTGVAINKKIAATFSESMDPLTITNTTFTVTGPGVTHVSGTVAYVGLIATFSPASILTFNTNYTATITTAARDLAGNAMAANYTWSFTTGAAPDTTPPTVTFTDPANGDTGVASDKKISATFSEGMDPLTITNTTFTVAGVTGTVAYDPITRIATFTPGNLAFNTTYTATISTAARDLAGNALAVNYMWSFTTGATPPWYLGAAAPFGSFGGGAGMTNQGLLTVINGDIGTSGVSTKITGFHDSVGDIYTETTLNRGTVTGRIYTAPPPPGGAGVGGNSTTFAIALAGANDALTAYNNLAGIPGGTDPGAGQLGGLTLAPGIYKAAGGSFLITGSDLTLDGQGNPNAVWVFQMATSLTVGGPGAAFPRSIILINGAQAKNVFWQVGSAATINAAGGGTMVGTIISSAGIAISTAGNVTIVTLNGRAIALNASVTVVNTVINVPAP